METPKYNMKHPRALNQLCELCGAGPPINLPKGCQEPKGHSKYVCPKKCKCVPSYQFGTISQNRAPHRASEHICSICQEDGHVYRHLERHCPNKCQQCISTSHSKKKCFFVSYCENCDTVGHKTTECKKKIECNDSPILSDICSDDVHQGSDDYLNDIDNDDPYPLEEPEEEEDYYRFYDY